MRVVIVEPTDQLRDQAAERLAVIDYTIAVTSIEQLYSEGQWHEVVILNEYNLILHHSPYMIQHPAIKGIWQLRGHRVIAFTATSSQPYERLVNNCIVPPVVLKFKSEYELIHDIAPVSDPTVITCVDPAALHVALCQDIDKHYEKHPVIVIANEV